MRNSSGLVMSQRKYASKLLECAEVLDNKPIATHMDPIIKLNSTYGCLLPGPLTYRTLVGKLLYLTITRPDLSFVAQALSQYSHSLIFSYFDAFIRVLRYIKLCPGQGLLFPANNTLHLTTYCDSDWAVVPPQEDLFQVMQSSLGIALSLGNLRNMHLSQEAQQKLNIRHWQIALMKSHGLKVYSLTYKLQFLPTLSLVMCDNVSTIALANNPIHHARTKHIEIDCHFIRDKNRQGHISPFFAPSKFQLADILTKGLSRVLHYKCLSKLGICDPYTLPTCGGDNVNTQALDPNTPKETAADPNTPTTKAQSLQRIATTPKMKLLLTQCLVRCNNM
nr:hypothetical protein [Tanacetum cinerariifolium]